MLYDDLQKVMKVIGDIKFPIHCTVAEQMVHNLIKTHNLYRKPAGLMNSNLLEYSPVAQGLFNKIDSIRNALNEETNDV